MVIIVLAAFGLGCAFGIFAMVPSWWRHRRLARTQTARAPATSRRRRAGRRRRRPAADCTRRAMDFELQWLLLGLPLAFVLGWLASRFDLRQFRREQQDSPKAYYKGLNLLLNEQHDKAIDAFIEAVQQDPDTSDLHFALGNLFRRRGEYERAVRVHQHLLGRADLPKAERERAQHALAQDFMKAGLFDRAEDAYKALAGTRLRHRGAPRPARPARARARLARGGRDRAAARDERHRLVRLAHRALLVRARARGRRGAPDRGRRRRRRRGARSRAARRPAAAARRRARRGARRPCRGAAPVEHADVGAAGVVQPGRPALRGERARRRQGRRRARAAALALREGADDRPARDHGLARVRRRRPPGAAARAPARASDDGGGAGAARVAHRRRPGADGSPPATAACPPRTHRPAPAVRRAARPLHRYRCAACGFEAEHYFWQCPGCLGWDTYPPQRLEDL